MQVSCTLCHFLFYPPPSSPEYMNNVLASGEVSNLFARDELDDISQDLIPVMKRQHPRRPPTSENLYDFFLSRVRSNLHVVLCFSPVGEKFRNRALKVRRGLCFLSFHCSFLISHNLLSLSSLVSLSVLSSPCLLFSPEMCKVLL